MELLLLEHDADVNVQNRDGDTPLCVAARYGHVVVMQELLKSHAGMRERTLANAAGGGHAQATELLLERGADVTLTDDLGQTALHKAARQHGKEVAQVVRLLLQYKADVNARDKRGQSSLTLHQNLEVMELLLRGGADRTSKDELLYRLLYSIHMGSKYGGTPPSQWHEEKALLERWGARHRF